MVPRALPNGALSALLLSLLVALGIAFGKDGGLFWDFQTYYAAARAHKAGLNPYDLAVLSEVMGRDLHHPYVYPPWTLYVFRLFTWCDYRTAAGLFLAAKVVSLWGLILLWQRLLGISWILLLLAPLAFAGASMIDLRAGNVAIFEQICLWVGFACHLRGKRHWFVACVLLAASFKILPLAFLGLLLIGPDRGGMRCLGIAASIAIALLLAQAWLSPELSSEFVGALDLQEERGSPNPCNYAFWGSVLHYFKVQGFDLSGLGLRSGLYVISSVAVLVLSIRAIRPMSSMRMICLATLCYALVMPRFKDYSYLLLVPAACAQCLAFRSGFWPWIAAIALILPTHSLALIGSAGLRGFLAYYPLYCALALWILALGTARRERVHADQDRQPTR